jgi:hypothetical protein
MRPKEESASEIQTKSELIYERVNAAVKALMNFLAATDEQQSRTSTFDTRPEHADKNLNVITSSPYIEVAPFI